MTDVVNSTPSRIQLIGINGQTQYFFNFTVYDPTEIVVWNVPPMTVGNEVTDRLVYLVDYTVTITGDTGGYVTLLTPSQGGEIITIQGDSPGQRVSNFGNNYNFTADNVNQEFNNMVLIYKQVNSLQTLNNLRYDYSQYIPPTKFQFPNLLPGYYPVGSSDGNYISQAPAPGQDDASAAQLRADLLAPSGDTIVGTATGYGTVRNNLVALNVRAPRYGVDTSVTPNVITVTYSPAPTSYETGELLEILVANSNNSSAVTINKNGLGTKNVIRADGEPLQSGDITVAIQQFIYDGTAYRLLNSSTSQGSWPPMYINNGYCTNNTLDPLHDIDFNPVTCRDFGNNINLELNSTITKSIDSNWAEGDGQGGFPSSEVLSPGDTVHMFIIAKGNGTIDAGFDKELDASGLLTDAAGAGYIYYRRMESGVVDASSNWRPFSRQGDYVNYIDNFTDYTLSANNSTTPYLIDIPIPKIKSMAILFIGKNGENATQRFSACFSAYTQDLLEANDNYCNSQGRLDTGVPSHWETTNSGVPIQTNELAQVYFVCSSNSNETIINAMGWVDKRDLF